MLINLPWFPLSKKAIVFNVNVEKCTYVAYPRHRGLPGNLITTSSCLECLLGFYGINLHSFF